MNSFKYQYFKIKLEEDFFNMLMQAINESGHMQKEGLAIAEENLMVAKVGGGQITKDRQCKVSFIDNPRVFELLDGLVEFANSKMLWNIKLDFIEPLQYTVYGEGEHYTWHHDEDLSSAYKPQNVGCRDKNAILNDKAHIDAEYIRKLSFSLQLTDETTYEGGNFQLMDGKKTYFAPRKRGTLVVFDSRAMHRVLPVTKGTRKSIVGWTLGPRWR